MSIKERLHQYIDKGDEKLLNLMYAVAREYNDEEDVYALSKEEIKELDERRKKRLSGNSKMYDWEQAKKIISRKND